jgi:LAS superfamily LD-carboxypeptidase LdcB
MATNKKNLIYTLILLSTVLFLTLTIIVVFCYENQNSNPAYRSSSILDNSNRIEGEIIIGMHDQRERLINFEESIPHMVIDRMASAQLIKGGASSYTILDHSLDNLLSLSIGQQILIAKDQYDHLNKYGYFKQNESVYGVELKYLSQYPVKRMVIIPDVPVYSDAGGNNRVSIGLGLKDIIEINRIFPHETTFDFCEFEHNGAPYYVALEYLAHIPDQPPFIDNISIGQEKVDRWHSLPFDYEPTDLVDVPDEYIIPAKVGNPNMKLRQEALNQFILFIEAARQEGFDLRMVSCYRSARYQVGPYTRTISAAGPKQKASAKPTYSEHQLGTTADLSCPEIGWAIGSHISERFYNLPVHKWIRENAHQFGLYISYSRNNYEETGYMWEPWHLRYWGTQTIP